MTLRRVLPALLILLVLAAAGWLLLRPSGPTTLIPPQTTSVIVTAQASLPTPATVDDPPTQPAAITAVAAPDSATTAATTPAATVPSAPSAAPSDTSLASRQSLDERLLRRRNPVQLAVDFGRTAAAERVARTTPRDVQVGQTEVFWVSDIPNSRYYTTTATLVFALDHILMYVEEGVNVDQGD